jgi:hypothetical protein
MGLGDSEFLVTLLTAARELLYLVIARRHIA